MNDIYKNIYNSKRDVSSPEKDSEDLKKNLSFQLTNGPVTNHEHLLQELPIFANGEKTFLNMINDDAESCRGKEVSELTEDQKFALCFISGCEIAYSKTEEDSDSLRMKTKHICSISKNSEGKFIIIEREKP